MTLQGIRSLSILLLFAYMKHSTVSDEILDKMLNANPEGNLILYLVSWEDFVMGLWIYSDKVLLIVVGYLLTALIGSLLLRTYTVPYTR